MRRLVALICVFVCVVGNACAELTAYFLDVGQADATVIVCDGQVMMIDGGNADDSQFIYSWLRNTMGITHIDVMVSSHPHEDHVGGLAAALNACSVGTVYTAALAYDSRSFNSFLKYCDLQGITPRIPDADEQISLGGAKVTFLNTPDPNTSWNNQSLTVRIDYVDASFLFTGDIGYATESTLLAGNLNLDVDVLKVAHHGSETSSSMAFLRAVSPLVSIISVGDGNTYGHPADSALRRLNETGTRIFRTDQSGTVTVTTDGSFILCTSEKGNARCMMDAK